MNDATSDTSNQWLDEIRWDSHGLLPVISQDVESGEILMFAWMNRDSLQLSVENGHAVYWSRSRKKLWRKGEESGHQQIIKSIRIDCDEDVLLIKVEQRGGIACHTGRQSCFYRELNGAEWKSIAPVIKDPAEIYKHS